MISGGFTQALVEVQGLAASTRWLLGTAALLQGIAAIFIGAAVISMCNGYISKTTFRPVLVKWFMVTAAVTVVCGMGWQVTESIAGMQASVQVLGFDASQFRTDVTERDDLRDIVGIPTPVYLENYLNFWPLWAGLGLFSTAQIFKRGLQMQKDTAGLIWWSRGFRGAFGDSVSSGCTARQAIHDLGGAERVGEHQRGEPFRVEEQSCQGHAVLNPSGDLQGAGLRGRRATQLRSTRLGHRL